MDVLSAGGFAPDNLLLLCCCVKLLEANRAISFDWFAFAVFFVVVVVVVCAARNDGWSPSKDLVELGGEKSELVD